MFGNKTEMCIEQKKYDLKFVISALKFKNVKRNKIKIKMFVFQFTTP